MPQYKVVPNTPKVLGNEDSMVRRFYRLLDRKNIDHQELSDYNFRMLQINSAIGDIKDEIMDETALEITRELKREGVSDETISKTTKLPLEKVAAIKIYDAAT